MRAELADLNDCAVGTLFKPRRHTLTKAFSVKNTLSDHDCCDLLAKMTAYPLY